jgi:tetratricopeptide (TPR) repeat protein
MRKFLLLLTFTFFMMGGSKAQSIAGARKLLYYERYDGAAHLLQTLLHADPANSEAWLLLTQTYVHQHRIPALRDTLRSMPAAVAQQPMGLCALGQLELEAHKPDSAAHYFEQALRMTKQKDPVILLAVARAHQAADSGNAPYAISLLNMAIKRDKHDPGLYVALGDAYRKLADGGSSFKAYQDALEQDKHYAAALYRLGKIFVSQNNPDMYVKYFTDAVTTDSLFAPAWYELYYYNYFRDVNKAMVCLDHYVAATDPGIANEYLITDLLYASRKYQAAIDHAQQLIAGQGGTSEPRLYKLIAYSYNELGDSVRALDFMKQYFHEQIDTGFVVKDYETMGDIYEKLGKTDSAAAYLAKAGNMTKDTVQRIAYAKKLAGLYKEQKDYANQAFWLERYYTGNPKATNLDLFNWGLAYYMAKEYPMADSIFGMYETKYPDQDFGFYWRARSDVAIDTAMSTGLAIPQYTKLIEIDSKDTVNKTNRRHLVEAYGYIAAYRANTQKDYTGAIDYFEHLLALDPGNQDAERYVGILRKALARKERSETATTSKNPGKDTDKEAAK